MQINHQFHNMNQFHNIFKECHNICYCKNTQRERSPLKNFSPPPLNILLVLTKLVIALINPNTYNQTYLTRAPGKYLTSLEASSSFHPLTPHCACRLQTSYMPQHMHHCYLYKICSSTDLQHSGNSYIYTNVRMGKKCHDLSKNKQNVISEQTSVRTHTSAKQEDNGQDTVLKRNASLKVRVNVAGFQTHV